MKLGFIKLRRDEKGAGMLEAALAVPFFLTFVLTSVELLRLTYVSYTTQFVASTVVREAAIGPTAFADYLSGGARTSMFPQRDFIRDRISALAGSFLVSIPTANVSICALAASDIAEGCTATAADEPGPGALYLVRVTSRVDLFGFSPMDITSSVFAKNERW
jgi:Flp pilus assembly protein TadG